MANCPHIFFILFPIFFAPTGCQRSPANHWEARLRPYGAAWSGDPWHSEPLIREPSRNETHGPKKLPTCRLGLLAIWKPKTSGISETIPSEKVGWCMVTCFVMKNAWVDIFLSLKPIDSCETSAQNGAGKESGENYAFPDGPSFWIILGQFVNIFWVDPNVSHHISNSSF